MPAKSFYNCISTGTFASKDIFWQKKSEKPLLQPALQHWQNSRTDHCIPGNIHLLCPPSSGPIFSHHLHTVLGLPRKGRDSLLSSHVDKMSHVNKGSVEDVGCVLLSRFIHSSPRWAPNPIASPQISSDYKGFVSKRKALNDLRAGKDTMLALRAAALLLLGLWGTAKSTEEPEWLQPCHLMSRELHRGVGGISSITFAPLPPACEKGEKFSSGLCTNATVKLQFKKSSERGSWGAVSAAATVQPCCSDPGGFPWARTRWQC